MKKIVKELNQKSIKEIELEISKLTQEIAKLRLETKVNPNKNTNFLFNKRKTLAVYLTILTEKKELEVVKKNK